MPSRKRSYLITNYRCCRWPRLASPDETFTSIFYPASTRGSVTNLYERAYTRMQISLRLLLLLIVQDRNRVSNVFYYRIRSNPLLVTAFRLIVKSYYATTVLFNDRIGDQLYSPLGSRSFRSLLRHSQRRNYLTNR